MTLELNPFLGTGVFFDFAIGDTHLNHIRIREFEPMRLAWGKDLDAHNDTILKAWNKRVQDGHRVLHMGDAFMGPREKWPGFRARMNGEITLLLGNHDREDKVMSTYGFRVCDSLSWQDPNLGLVIARHDPAKFTQEEIARADILLHAHLHSGTHHPATPSRKYLCLSIELLPHTPEPLSYQELVEMVRR